jgi:hypothetical protein
MYINPWEPKTHPWEVQMNQALLHHTFASLSMSPYVKPLQFESSQMFIILEDWGA